MEVNIGTPQSPALPVTHVTRACLIDPSCPGGGWFFAPSLAQKSKVKTKNWLWYSKLFKLVLLFYLVGVSSGLSTQDSTLKEEAGESDKEDDIETLLDDPAELENSSFVRRRETKKYIKAEEEENEMNELIYQEKPKSVSTELARRMLQKNLERLLYSQNCCSKDVISELTGSMTPTQVQKLVEKTNSELCRNNSVTQQAKKTTQAESILKKKDKHNR